jgi:hypothetical protein
MTEVLISRTRTRSQQVYHTDHRCPNRPDEPVPRPLLWIADDDREWRECEYCCDEISFGYQAALRDAESWDDLSLDDGGESA